MTGAAGLGDRFEGRTTVSVARELGALGGWPLAALAMVGVAWATLVLLDASGAAAVLHHHALIEDGPPVEVAVPLFLTAWQVMIAAMMLPASLPAIRSATLAPVPRNHPLRVEIAFLVGFFVIWAGFGLAAFLGDMVVHRMVGTTPWLASRPWLIEAGVLALAGGYQFLPAKRRGLERCRRPGDHRTAMVSMAGGPVSRGLEHGFACLGSSWALMLLMFGEGFAGLGWMVGLTAVMTLETLLPSPRRLSALVGLGLILLSLWTLSGPSPT